MVSRDELYRLVWSEPMTKTAERFDVSGSYLARICTLLNVPRPAQLLDQIRSRQSTAASTAPDLRHSIEAIHKLFKADVTIVEDADLGRGIVQDLRRTPGPCKPIAIKPRIDKIAGMQAHSIMFETGKVQLPMRAPWLNVYVAELLGFPNSRYADPVDSTSQALDYIQRRVLGRLRR